MPDPRVLVERLAALDDELCTWPDSSELYTRGNGADQWPHPVFPLTQELVTEPQIRGLDHTFATVLKLVTPAGPWHSAGIFYGFVAVGLGPTFAMADNTPGWSAQAVAQQYFGLPPDPAFEPPPKAEGRARFVATAVRVLRAGRSYPKDARRREAPARERWREARRRDWTGASDAELVGIFRRQQSEAVAGRAPLLIANVLAASGYERLVKLATACAGDDGPRLAATAVGGLGGFQLGDAMDALSGVARGDGSLDGWIEQYGFRGPVEYELAASPWGDDEHQLASMLEQARGRAGDDDEAAKRARAHDEATRARAELRRRAGTTRAPMLAYTLRDLETHTRWRENAKVHEVLEVAVVRLAAREAGRRLAAAGTIDAPDDVFFLRARELNVALTTDSPPPLREAVDRRRAQRRLQQALELPELFLAEPGELSLVPDERIHALGLLPGPPAGTEATDGADTGRDGVLRGVGVSAGTVTAAVRIVTDPYDAGIEPGEVLVAHTTDPAWTPLFLQASGVVIDYGGPLSHGAVISRELGIPCVINVKEATTRLVTGGVVTVDGTAGEVRPG